MKKYLFLIFFVFLIGCRSEQVVSEKTIFVMDTFVNIKIYSDQEEKAVLNEIEELFAYYHQLTDRYESVDNMVNVYSINNMDEEYLIIDEELVSLINYGLDFYVKSEGLFDIGMGNLIDVWKKHIQEGEGLPKQEDLNQIEKSEIIIKDNKIYQGVNLDLGALAKGYALSKVEELLKEREIDQYIINAGGQVLVGERYRDVPYNIGVAHPFENENLIVLKAENINVSTSGSYERFFELDGEIYHHIIDPKTLYPAEYFASVTVVSEDSLLADVLTTTLFLMPIEEGKDFLTKYDAEALWYTFDQEKIKSAGFYKYE